LRITPVDPLAREYDRLLADFGLEPPIRTVFCPGEQLLERFPPGYFDVAYARNSVDHSYDAAGVVRNMVELVRPGGYVLLRHVRREGEHMKYTGFHQWNLDVEAGHLVLWNKVRRHDLTRELERVARVEAYRNHDGEEDWVIAVIRKLGQPRRREGFLRRLLPKRLGRDHLGGAEARGGMNPASPPGDPAIAVDEHPRDVEAADERPRVDG
jgi:SAM-dependent methyltransferase